ncbi:hypothetical protein B0A54_17241 [Friedmanniomyces endolithicus]|uniref:Myb/SANT-like domain-containing protein n=1 Tax=Friedmanniomyces endolithicus TaxID=329885 RepID=A0A4U0TW41_9PEZI|nr:hypothetical protein B0A54_17241 [Friedmanniomyces endolithicus]
MPSTKRPATTSPTPPPKRRALPSKWRYHPSSTDHLLNLCIRRADTRNRLGTETASRAFSENEWRAITSHLNTEFTTRFEWTQCRSKFLELRGLWEVWLALYKRVVDKWAPNTWKGGRRIRGRWISRVGDTPKNTVQLGEVYFEAFEGVEKVGHERLKEQYGRLVRLFGEDLAFGRYAYFVDEVSLTGSEGEDGGDAEEMGSCEEDGEDVEEGSVGEDDGEIVEESTRSERDGDDLGGNPDIEDDGVDLEESSSREGDGKAHKQQSMARVGTAIGAQRTATGRLSRSRKAIAARREEKWCEEIKKLTAAVLEEPKSTITTAIERCKPLLAVQQLTPDDQDDLFQALAQSTNADIIVELPKEDLVWYAEELLLEVKQSPRAALNRCSKLAAFKELQPSDRNLLYAAVMQPPRAKTIAALSDTDLAAFLEELLVSLKQAAAAKSCSPPHSGLVAALSDADLVEYTKALLNSLKQAPAARESFAGGPPEIQLKGGSTATAAAVPAAAIAPIPEGRAGVDTAILPLARAMAQGERPSLSLLGYGWTAQPWARELTDYLWGQFYKDMACGTVGTGSLSAPAVEAGAVSWRAA